MIDFKKASVSIPLTAVLAGAVWAGGYYLDKTYIRQETYRQAQIDNRVFKLQDDKDAIQDQVDIQGGEPTDYQKMRIRRLTTQMEQLRSGSLR